MTTSRQKKIDAVVIGGGFYGCMLSLALKKIFDQVILVEKEDQILTKASYYNQARIHNGYHYPRSFITALSSHLNYQRFCLNFKKAVDSSYTMIYAIASNNSKVSSRQFVRFCKQIGSPVKSSSLKITKLFNKTFIEDVFDVEENVFNAGKLRKILENKLLKAKVKVILGSEVHSISKLSSNSSYLHLTKRKSILANQVFLSTYSQINTFLKNSNLPLLPLKYELTEMPLVKLPEPLKKYGLTIMDGPFFSILPFPDKKLHSIHHVRYTPHYSFTGTYHEGGEEEDKESRFPLIIKDACRFLPLLSQTEYKDSFFQVKTILESSDATDGRPILYRRDYDIKNFHVILGGKIDNAYDIVEKLNNQQL